MCVSVWVGIASCVFTAFPWNFSKSVKNNKIVKINAHNYIPTHVYTLLYMNIKRNTNTNTDRINVSDSHPPSSALNNELKRTTPSSTLRTPLSAVVCLCRRLPRRQLRRTYSLPYFLCRRHFSAAERSLGRKLTIESLLSVVIIIILILLALFPPLVVDVILIAIVFVVLY